MRHYCLLLFMLFLCVFFTCVFPVELLVMFSDSDMAKDSVYDLHQYMYALRPPLWSDFLAADPEARVRFLALPDFLRSNGSG
jgi:hypothetical protein